MCNIAPVPFSCNAYLAYLAYPADGGTVYSISNHVRMTEACNQIIPAYRAMAECGIFDIRKLSHCKIPINILIKIGRNQ